MIEYILHAKILHTINGRNITFQIKRGFLSLNYDCVFVTQS